MIKKAYCMANVYYFAVTSMNAYGQLIIALFLLCIGMEDIRKQNRGAIIYMRSLC